MIYSQQNDDWRVLVSPKAMISMDCSNIVLKVLDFLIQLFFLVSICEGPLEIHHLLVLSLI